MHCLGGGRVGTNICKVSTLAGLGYYLVAL